MVPPDAHSHADPHGHPHVHAHGAASPHPPQSAPWSILRMPVVARLGAACAVSVVLWAIVLVARR